MSRPLPFAAAILALAFVLPVQAQPKPIKRVEPTVAAFQLADARG